MKGLAKAEVFRVTRAADMICFLDFAASSLLPRSFAVELAWVNQNGKGEHYLSGRIPSGWRVAAPGWNRESEAVHGISLETLIREGTPIERVAVRAAKVLFAHGAVAFTDQPCSDGQWLDALDATATAFAPLSITATITHIYLPDSHSNCSRPTDAFRRFWREVGTPKFETRPAFALR